MLLTNISHPNTEAFCLGLCYTGGLLNSLINLYQGFQHWSGNSQTFFLSFELVPSQETMYAQLKIYKIYWSIWNCSKACNFPWWGGKDKKVIKVLKWGHSVKGRKRNVGLFKKRLCIALKCWQSKISVAEAGLDILIFLIITKKFQ